MTSKNRPTNASHCPVSIVKEIVKCDPGVVAECTTVFPPNDPVFDGHFAGDPLVPGVVLTEALAETAKIAAASRHSFDKQAFVLSAVQQIKFFAPVRPDEQVRLTAERLSETEQGLHFKVAASVNGREVATGQLVLSAR